MTFDIKKKSAKPLTPNTTNTTIFHRQPSSLIEKHMMEDPGIKLFGKKIVLAEFSKTAILPVLSREEKDQLKANYSETKAELDNPKTPSINEESKTEGSEPKTKNPKPKTLEKPDKILACPRCTSMDTKFCYYNNYNVNQPRHFCKSCQRYWTAGGAMRTMQVGAGRRKNKNSMPIHVQQENGFHSKNPWPYNPWNSPIPSPMPVYPSTYLNGIPFLPPSTNASKPIMGKHSRDETLMKTSECDDVLKKPKNSVLIPKTLRIDDPNEASKSSIWVSLGIKNENFKAFQEKGKEGKKHQETTNSVAVHANPAAFSRSICFQENA